MRIVSLLPSATEILYLLGLGDFLVARSHDSDYPLEALAKPVVSDTVIDTGQSSREIDRAVRSSLHTGKSLFHINQDVLRELRPTLVLTQELCRVCAPSFSEVKASLRILGGEPSILSLEPSGLEDVLENIRAVGAHTGMQEEAERRIEELQRNMGIVEAGGHAPPSVAVVEWLDPIMFSGHWVPEMIAKAGGRPVLARPRAKSRYGTWEELREANPDVLLFAPCGFDIARTEKEIALFTERADWTELKAVREGRVYVMDGDAYLTRSGPRLFEGIHILAKILHPEVYGTPSLKEAVRV